MNKYTINDITRASGGFAMLAVDQREAMRMMFAAAGAPAPVADSVLTDFKVNAAKALSPYASAEAAHEKRESVSNKIRKLKLSRFN